MYRWTHIALAIGLLAAPTSAAEVTENRELPPFEIISADGTMTIDVTVGDAQSVRVVRDESVPVDTEVRDGVLRVRSISSPHADRRVSVLVTVPRLDGVALEGIGSHLAVRNIQAQNFRVALSSSSDATLSGTCETGEFSIAGSPRINAEALACMDVDVDIAGSGQADVRASRRATIRVLGSGDVDLYGGAEVIASRSTQRKIRIHHD